MKEIPPPAPYLFRFYKLTPDPLNALLFTIELTECLIKWDENTFYHRRNYDPEQWLEVLKREVEQHLLLGERYALHEGRVKQFLEWATQTAKELFPNG